MTLGRIVIEHPDDAQPPPTGLPRVDEAIARLADLDERPVNEHPEALAALHETLHSELESSSEPTDV